MRSLNPKKQLILVIVLVAIGSILSLAFIKIIAFIKVNEKIDTVGVVSVALKQGVSHDEFEQLINEIGLHGVLEKSEIIISVDNKDIRDVRILNVYGNGGHSTFVYQDGYYLRRDFKESNIKRTHSLNNY